MEASDITGELHLCMQVISTCSFEQELYGHNLLDMIHDYHSLMEFFHRLNEIVNHFLTGTESAADISWLKKIHCSLSESSGYSDSNVLF